MNCTSCGKQVVADRIFCIWCEGLISNPKVGTKAGLARRWFATVLDSVSFVLLFGVLGLFDEAESDGSFVLIIVLAYIVFFLWFLSRGMTPGKWLLDEQVVEKLHGEDPGLGRMLLREVIGKFVSGLFFGLGYLWAVWDNDQHAWHDKIAGTVVVRRSKEPLDLSLAKNTE